MTNAPFMLNVDCDMFANNPQVVQHAMCYFLGAKDEKDCGFVQFPQYFYDGLKDDPYGNQFKLLHEVNNSHFYSICIQMGKKMNHLIIHSKTQLSLKT